jgi:hypothetical protein
VSGEVFIFLLGVQMFDLAYDFLLLGSILGIFVFPVDEVVFLLPKFKEFHLELGDHGYCPSLAWERELLNPVLLQVLVL